MGGKKKKAKDPLKKAALAAKKEAKADKAASKRLRKEQERQGGDAAGTPATDLDAVLAAYRERTTTLAAATLEPLDTAFPFPPRGNFTWTLANGMFYMVRRRRLHPSPRRCRVSCGDVGISPCVAFRLARGVQMRRVRVSRRTAWRFALFLECRPSLLKSRVS